MRNNDSGDNIKKPRKVFAIISDYDGTLCPTNNIRAGRGRDNSQQDSRIPEGLENLLVQVSRQTPVCILSSKDYWFLHDRVHFADIISCILGIETVVVDRDENKMITNIVHIRYLPLEGNHDGAKLLKRNDRDLNHLAEDVASRFPEIDIERKYTLDGSLAGVTFDWRSQKDWTKYSFSLPAYIKEDMLLHEPYRFFHLQTYKSHPFVDVYAAECNKGVGFDCIVEELLLRYPQGVGDILYLGDSENDNPAFRKASLSVGIVSDSRLNSDLECQFVIDYDQLPNLLGLLMDNDFVVSEKVLAAMRQN